MSLMTSLIVNAYIKELYLHGPLGIVFVIQCLPVDPADWTLCNNRGQ